MSKRLSEDEERKSIGERRKGTTIGGKARKRKIIGGKERKRKRMGGEVRKGTTNRRLTEEKHGTEGSEDKKKKRKEK